MVDTKKIDAAIAGPKRQHDSQKVRIGFDVRAAQAVRDAAHAGMHFVGPEKTDIADLLGQSRSDRQPNQSAGDLLLVRYAIVAAQSSATFDKTRLYSRQLRQPSVQGGYRSRSWVESLQITSRCSRLGERKVEHARLAPPHFAEINIRLNLSYLVAHLFEEK